MTKESHRLLLLPYVSLEKDFTVGNLVFYSFKQSGEKYIKDKWLYENVKKVIPCFARFNMHNFDYLRFCDGTLIYEAAAAKIKLDPYDIVELISYVELDSPYDTPNTWDIRPIVILKGDKEAQFKVSKNNFGESLLPKMVFYPPDFLEMRRFNPDYLFPQDPIYRFEKSDMLLGLIQCLLKREKGAKEERNEFKRIIAAVKFRNQSERREYQHKENIRIVLIAAAFEALFNLPAEEIGKMFQNSVILLLGSCTDELRHWAKQFYALRSRIVHGTDVSDLKYQSSIKEVPKHIDHYRLAKVIFDECLKAKLYLMGLHEQYQYYRPCTLPEIERILIPNKKKIDTLLKLKPTEVCTNPIGAIEYVKCIDDVRQWDESTTKEDCLKAVTHIRDIIEESVGVLLNIDEIKKGFSSPLNDILKTLKEKPCDNKLHYELFWAMCRYDEENNKRNKLWTTASIQKYITIDRLVSDMHRISDMIKEE